MVSYCFSMQICRLENRDLINIRLVGSKLGNNLLYIMRLHRLGISFHIAYVHN